MRGWRALFLALVCGTGLFLGGHRISMAQSFPKPTLKRVLLMLQHSYWRVKWRGLCDLQTYYPKNKKAMLWVLPILLPPASKDLYSTRWRLRLRAARWLGSLTDHRAWTALRKASRVDRNWRVRLGLIKILATSPVQKRQVCQTLRALQKDRHPQVRVAATLLLRRCKSQKT